MRLAAAEPVRRVEKIRIRWSSEGTQLRLARAAVRWPPARTKNGKGCAPGGLPAGSRHRRRRGPQAWRSRLPGGSLLILAAPHREQSDNKRESAGDPHGRDTRTGPRRVRDSHIARAKGGPSEGPPARLSAGLESGPW